MAPLGAIAENIALLELLDSREEYSENFVPPKFLDQNHASRYALSLEDERRTAEAFAILLTNTDDCTKVGAVCVEQPTHGRGLVIRTAVSKGSQENRKDAFVRITTALKKASNAGPQRKKVDILMDEIISACQLRLLGRLRSRHAPPTIKEKAPIIPKLYKNLNFLDYELLPPERITFFEDQVNSMKMSFDALEYLGREDARSKAGRQLLKDILRSVKILLPRIDSQSTLVNSDNSGDNTYKSLQKLHQYYVAAQYLLRAARKFHPFRDLRIEEVSVGPFRERLPTAEASIGEGIFSRSVDAETLTPNPREEIFVSMLEKRSRKDVEDISNFLRRSSNLKKRVHAEIQLLYHYEQQKNKERRPRVIVSNKHACFLCNLFLKVHGGFYVRSSHGNFYPAWRIPQFDEVNLSKEAKGRMMQCLDRFNSELESKIEKCVAQERRILPDQQESIIFKSYTPTISSRMPTAPNARKSAQGGPPLSIDSGFAQAQRNSKISLPQVPVELPPEAEEQRPTVVSIPVPASPPQSTTSINPTSLPKRKRTPSIQSSRLGKRHNPRPNILTRGVPMTYTLTPGSLARFHTSRIHLELSYDQASSLSSFPPSLASTRTPLPANSGSDADLILHVEWLDPDSWYPGRLRRAIDTGGRWATMRMKDGILFGKDGLVLMEKDNVVCLKALRSS